MKGASVSDRDPMERLTPFSPQVTSAFIAEQVRELIADGSFPQGSSISEVAVATAMGISRGPVREALQRLVQEGLLTNERNRKLSVPRLTGSDIIDIYRTREAIELSAMEAVINRPDNEEVIDDASALLAQMAAHVAEGDRKLISLADLDFHLLLIRESKRPRLERAFATLLVETRMCMNELERIHRSQDDSVEIHQHILDAVITKDMDAARAALRMHNQTVLRDFKLSNDLISDRDSYARKTNIL